jgi:inactivated superfamily I helicase
MCNNNNEEIMENENQGAVWSSNSGKNLQALLNAFVAEIKELQQTDVAAYVDGYEITVKKAEENKVN